MLLHFFDRKGEEQALRYLVTTQWTKLSRGQAMVEMAIVITILMFVMVLAVQFAMLGSAVLALNQVTYQGARYASVNQSASQAAVQSYMLSVGSPTITFGGGANLSVTLSPTATPRTSFSTITVSSTFNAKSFIVIPNPFFGVKLPTTLTASESAMVE
jgi:MFS superfamily sulfate permease-like transporter